MKAELAAPRTNALEIVPMTLDDVGAVMLIEGIAFTSSWPVDAFRSEVADNKLARYFIGRLADAPGAPVVAYGGIWVILEDSHVTTIAVHPQHQGRGFGDRMFLRLVRAAIAGGACWMTLEVRESNVAAQRLYEKYGFVAVSVRKAYYSDNGENALVMWAGNLQGDLYASRLRTIERAQRRGPA